MSNQCMKTGLEFPATVLLNSQWYNLPDFNTGIIGERKEDRLKKKEMEIKNVIQFRFL